MKRTSLFLWLLLLLKATAVHAQNPETNLSFVPVSPNAAALGTFGTVPTNNYLGQANLSIPIYEIDLDGKKFPITLSYHTDGTRVAQEATWVGLGWTLQAGGCIIRQLQGLDDLAPWGHYVTNGRAPWVDDPFFLMNSDNYVEYKPYFEGKYDAEPDIFYFSAGGHSGSMYFEAPKDGLPVIAVPTIQSQEQVVKMAYDRNRKNWTMTDPEGYVYTFSKGEVTRLYQRVEDFYDKDFPRSDILISKRHSQMTTAWMLDSIVSPNGHKMTFNYKMESIYTPVSTTEEGLFFGKYLGGMILNSPFQFVTEDRKYTYSYSVIEQQTLSDITFEGGKVEFVTTDREDIESYKNGKKVQKLSEIKVSDTDRNLVKTTKLEYCYLLSRAADTSYGANDRLLLTKVYDAAGSARSNAYTLDYNMGTLPSKRSPYVDAWGFYNAASPTPSSYRLRLSPSIYWPTSAQPDDDSPLFEEGMDRSFVERLCQIGTLRAITYPTKGTTVFEYEGHRFDEPPLTPPLRRVLITSIGGNNAPMSTSSNLVYYQSAPFEVDDHCPQIMVYASYGPPRPDTPIPDITGFSVRVEKIDGGTCSIVYSSPEWNMHTTGMATVKLEKGTYRARLTVTGNSLIPPVNVSAKIYGNTNAPLDEDYLGAGLRVKSINSTDGNGHSSWRKFRYTGARLMTKAVFNAAVDVMHSEAATGCWMNSTYQLVQSVPYVPLTSMSRSFLVGYNGVEESYGDTIVQGYTNYQYCNLTDQMPESYLAGIPTVPNFANGKPMRVTYLSKEHRILKQELYSYSSTPLKQMWVPKMRFYYLSTDYEHPAPSIQRYLLTAQSFYLKQKTVVDYHSKGNIADTERYSYTDYGMLASRKSDKHGVEKETLFKYAHDYTDTVAKKMCGKHMIGIPIERIELSGDKVTGASKTEYKDTLDMILPKRTWRFDSAVPKTLTDYTGAYVQDVLFGKYTSRGRLLDYVRGNLPVTFLWAYNNLYPVARIEGKTYEEVEKLAETGIGQLPTSTSATSIAAILKSIRNKLADSNALVTTYLHKPLVGMTETVAPNGQKTSFEYDIFNRLLWVKDHDGMATERYDYNYRQE